MDTTQTKGQFISFIFILLFMLSVMFPPFAAFSANVGLVTEGVYVSPPFVAGRNTLFLDVSDPGVTGKLVVAGFGRGNVAGAINPQTGGVAAFATIRGVRFVITGAFNLKTHQFRVVVNNRATRKKDILRLKLKAGSVPTLAGKWEGFGFQSFIIRRIGTTNNFAGVFRQVPPHQNEFAFLTGRFNGIEWAGNVRIVEGNLTDEGTFSLFFDEGLLSEHVPDALSGELTNSKGTFHVSIQKLN